MLKDLIIKTRSYRRFYQDYTITRETVMELLDIARLTASGANLQPLKYIPSCDPQRNDLIFPHLAWARYLKDWKGPEEGERPSAYIIMLGDLKITQTFGYDPGIAALSMLLGATERGLGGCMIGSIQREKLREALDISSRYEILLVLALGKPRENVVIETMAPDGDTTYWRDSESVHHVPKRRLEDIVLG